jgi:hypothetical protein
VREVHSGRRERTFLSCLTRPVGAGPVLQGRAGLGQSETYFFLENRKVGMLCVNWAGGLCERGTRRGKRVGDFVKVTMQGLKLRDPLNESKFTAGIGTDRNKMAACRVKSSKMEWEWTCGILAE